MRFKTGPSFSAARSAPSLAALAAASLAHVLPEGLPAIVKSDVEITDAAITGDVVSFTLPSYDLATANRLMEVRAYAVHGDFAPLADGPAYEASTFPYGVVDVSNDQAGGFRSINLPPALADGVYFIQTVLGFDV